MSLLFRRREIWLPTWFGGLLMLSVAALLLGLVWFRLADFLTVREPAHGRDGRGARTLIIEGWLEAKDLDQAIAVYRSGRYERVLTTGGPIDSWTDARRWGSYAERAAAYLQENGPGPATPVIALPAPATRRDRTYLSALVVRDWAHRSGLTLDAVDLYSAGVHSRRSRLIYRLAFGDEVEVGVLASSPVGYSTEHWWDSSLGARAVMSEALAYVWVKCCFWPGAPPPLQPLASASPARVR